MYAFMWACLYAGLYVCLYASLHVFLYVRLHVCFYACLYACMYACLHACLYACLCLYKIVMAKNSIDKCSCDCVRCAAVCTCICTRMFVLNTSVRVCSFLWTCVFVFTRAAVCMLMCLCEPVNENLFICVFLQELWTTRIDR